MKKRGGQKTKPQLYSHIASAIIPVTGVVAVPQAAHYFPQQKTRANEEWGPMASTLLHATTMNQMLIPSPSLDGDDHDDQLVQQRARKGTPIGRMDASTDEDESDEDSKRKHQASTRPSVVKSTTSRTASLSDAEKRLFGHVANDEDSTTTTTADPGLSSTIHLDAKKTVPIDPTQSTATTTTTTTDDKVLKRATVTVTRQQVPALVLNPTASRSGPSPARTHSPEDIYLEGIGSEVKSTTTRSSLNDSTTIPVSARSVSFKEPVIHETYDPPSSQSQQASTVITNNNREAVLDRLVIPPPQEYQQNFNDLEKRNQLLNDEVQQLRINNRNLQKQQEDLHTRLQTSQKLSQKELNQLLQQAGHDRTKSLEQLNQTLQNRCDQLQNELSLMRERQTQDQGQSSARELKTENHFLKDYIHRLTVAANDYQILHPPDVLKTDQNKDSRKLQGIPMKGPSPIWLLNQKFLAPLFLSYDERLHERKEFIRKLQIQLSDIHDQMNVITSENLSLHERIARTSTSSVNQSVTHLPDLESIKRQAYLVLEENKVLHDQLELQTNRLTDVQKSQIHEVSNLSRRLMVAESEKAEADRTLETIRIRNEDLRKKYEQVVVDKDHRIHVEDHVREMNEMKRVTDELSEKHVSEMQLLLRRVQDAEAAKKSAQLKLAECRSDMEHLKGDVKQLNKVNRKLQLRLQTFEKKFELQNFKEQRITSLLEKAIEDGERSKLEQETYLLLAKTKEEEMNKANDRMQEETKKSHELETRLESQKNKSKERIDEFQEQMKQQYDNLKIRCAEHEQRLRQLITLLNEKQVLIDDLNSEKRNLEVDLETIWKTTNADNIRMREQLRDMRVTG